MKFFKIIVICVMQMTIAFSQTKKPINKPQIAQIPEFDGVYVLSEGKYKMLKKSECRWASFMCNMFGNISDMKRAMEFCHNNSEVTNLNGVSKIILKGFDFNDNTVVQFSECINIPLGSCQLQKVYGGRFDYDASSIWIQDNFEKGQNRFTTETKILLPMKRKKIAENLYEIIVETPLEAGKNYCVYVFDKDKPNNFYIFNNSKYSNMTSGKSNALLSKSPDTEGIYLSLSKNQKISFLPLKSIKIPYYGTVLKNKQLTLSMYDDIHNKAKYYLSEKDYLAYSPQKISKSEFQNLVLVGSNDLYKNLFFYKLDNIYVDNQTVIVAKVFPDSQNLYDGWEESTNAFIRTEEVKFLKSTANFSCKIQPEATIEAGKYILAVGHNITIFEIY